MMPSKSVNDEQRASSSSSQHGNGTSSSTSSFRHNNNGTNSNNFSNLDYDDDNEVTPMSNSALEAKARQLREQSNSHSQILTQKLASSQSGQNLLHMGTSLSTLPPDLHLLLQNLHPILSATELTEKQQMAQLEQVVLMRREILRQEKRCRQAEAAAELYQDLVAAEMTVRRDLNWRRYGSMDPNNEENVTGDDDESDDGEEGMFV